MTSRGRRGLIGYADLLRLVFECPGTTRELADRFGMAVRSMREALQCMHAAGLVFERSWRPSTTGERLQAVWSTEGPPAPRPAELAAAVDPVPMPQLTRFCSVLTALMDGAFSPAELADAAGVSIRRLRPLMHHLLNQLRMVFVERWRQTPGSWPVPIYRWGPGRRSARRPKPRPESEGWRKQHAIRQQRLFWVHMIFLTAGPTPANRSEGA